MVFRRIDSPLLFKEPGMGVLTKKETHSHKHQRSNVRWQRSARLSWWRGVHSFCHKAAPGCLQINHSGNKKCDNVDLGKTSDLNEPFALTKKEIMEQQVQMSAKSLSRRTQIKEVNKQLDPAKDSSRTTTS